MHLGAVDARLHARPGRAAAAAAAPRRRRPRRTGGWRAALRVRQVVADALPRTSCGAPRTGSGRARWPPTRNTRVGWPTSSSTCASGTPSATRPPSGGSSSTTRSRAGDRAPLPARPPRYDGRVVVGRPGRACRPSSCRRSRGRVVVVGAHPDDETLGAGGLLHAAARAGRSVEVVTATAGEGSHPHSPTHAPGRLARCAGRSCGGDGGPRPGCARRPASTSPTARWPTTRRSWSAALVDAIGTDGDAVLLCAPWRDDGHPDHEAVGRAAATAAHRTDALLWEYPVWWWHWGRPDDLSAAQVARLPLSTDALSAKRAAVDAHASQVRPLSAAPGDEVLLGPDLLAHFDRDHEVFLVGGPEADDDVPRPGPPRATPTRGTSTPSTSAASAPCRWRACRGSTTRSRSRSAARSVRWPSTSRRAATGCWQSTPAARGRRPRPSAYGRHRPARGAAGPGARTSGRRRATTWCRCPRSATSSAPAGSLSSSGSASPRWPTTGTCSCATGATSPSAGRWPGRRSTKFVDAFLATGGRVLVEHQEPDFLLHVLGRSS